MSYVFDADLKTFVREVLQNSHDQKVDERADVIFEFYELQGPELEAFLRAISWDDLSDHLQGVAEQDVLTSRTTAETLEAINSGQPLRLLKVSDYGTVGLVGSEDEAGTNYKALVKDVLETTDSGSKKGGSHGLGKAVLWAFSSISTVLFSSTFDDGQSERLRFVGRADFPFHTTSEIIRGWEGSGWYGEEDPPEEPDRAESVWGDAARELVGDLLLERPDWMGHGTSILIPAFFEPREEEQKTLEEVAAGVIEAAVESFWPAIAKGSLNVKTSVHYPDGTTSDLLAASELGRVGPYIKAASTEDVLERAVHEGEVAERQIEVKFPARVDDPSGRSEVTGTARLALHKSSETEDDGNANRVALVRGAGMVVEYWKPKRQPLSGGAFHAVLHAGYARGDSEADGDLEAFLRASEPPAHNKWDPRTNRIRNEYKAGSVAAMNRLWEDISTAVVNLCETPPPPDQDGPDRLKKLLPIGRGGEIPKQTFRVTYKGGHFDGEHWTMSARVQRLRGHGEWRTDVTAILDGESGRGVPIGVVGGELEQGSAATAEIIDGKYRILIHGADDVSFTINARAVDLDDHLLRRSRARLHAHSHAVEQDSQ